MEPMLLLALNLLALLVWGVLYLYIFKKSRALREERQQREMAAYSRLENELTQNRIAIMLSQIQPHFLYNTLVVIKQLCDIDPKAAKETVSEFSDYLRANLDSLTRIQPIPFEKELEHVKNYLALEKKRFGGRVRVVWELSATEFLIPALTVQAIVENAVRYGITKKEEGGSVTVRTAQTDAETIITVSDDGAGFDPDRPPQDGRSHVGIENVRSRLASACGGALDIQSTVGVGTTVTLRLPRT